MNFRLVAVVSLSLLALVAGGCKKQPAPADKSGGDSTEPSPMRAAEASSADWSGFRGPGGRGVAPADADPLVTFDLARDIRWKVKLSVEGNGSPVVSGGKVFLTGEKQEIAAFDTSTGEPLWSVALPPVAGEVESFADTGLAAPTPCTDGRHVVAFFGTGQLACATAGGKLLWSNRLVENIESPYGLSASPILHKNLVIQVVDMDSAEAGKSFIAAYGVRDGKQVWKTARPVDACWASPAIASGEGGDVLLVSGKPWTIGYDPATGKELWRVEGLTGDVGASPAASDNLAFFCSDPYGPLLAVRAAATDGQAGGDVVWRTQEDLPDVASPVSAGGKLFLLSESGKLKCLNATDGKSAWNKELSEHFWASPILAAGRLYLLSKEGKLLVVSAENGELLGSAELGEPAVATPAIVGRGLFVRTSKHLWRLESPQ